MCLRIPKMLGCGHSWTFGPVSNWVVNITIWYRYVECWLFAFWGVGGGVGMGSGPAR